MTEQALDRTPPNDFAAEQAVLGSMLLSRDAIADVVEVLRGHDFYRPIHEQVFNAALDLFGRGEPVDAVTIANELSKRGDVTKLPGGPTYLVELTQSVSVAANASYYAGIVRDKAVLRRLADASHKVGQMAYQAQGEVDSIVDAAQQVIYDVTDRSNSDNGADVSDLIQPHIDYLEGLQGLNGRMVGVPTGFKDLDELTNGLQPGQMVIVAARPAVGKSTLALDIARAAAVKHERKVAFYSLEMGRDEIMSRLMSAEGQIPLQAIRTGKMSEPDWGRYAQAASRVKQASLHIDDSTNLTMMEIRAKARRMKQRRGLDLVIVDYIQLMTSGKKVESRQVEVSEFSRQIKLLAKELDVPVVALAQLNRGSEQRADKTPMLSDLRESGSLEQDSDLVILLHREDLYDPQDRPGEADLIVAKHRNGPTRTIPVAFQGHYSRFVDMQPFTGGTPLA